jgi:hypothetical protein
MPGKQSLYPSFSTAALAVIKYGIPYYLSM